MVISVFELLDLFLCRKTRRRRRRMKIFGQFRD